MGINVGETLMGLVTTSGIYQYLTNPLAHCCISPLSSNLSRCCCCRLPSVCC